MEEAAPIPAGAGPVPAGRSPFQMAMRRFFRNRKALLSAAVLGLVAAATLLVPWITPHD